MMDQVPSKQSERVSIFCARCHVEFSAAVGVDLASASEDHARAAVRRLSANKGWTWKQGRFGLMEDVCRACQEVDGDR